MKFKSTCGNTNKYEKFTNLTNQTNQSNQIIEPYYTYDPINNKQTSSYYPYTLYKSIMEQQITDKQSMFIEPINTQTNKNTNTNTNIIMLKNKVNLKNDITISGFSRYKNNIENLMYDMLPFSKTDGQKWTINLTYDNDINKILDALQNNQINIALVPNFEVANKLKNQNNTIYSDINFVMNYKKRFLYCLCNKIVNVNNTADANGYIIGIPYEFQIVWEDIKKLLYPTGFFGTVIFDHKQKLINDLKNNKINLLFLFQNNNDSIIQLLSDKIIIVEVKLFDPIQFFNNNKHYEPDIIDISLNPFFSNIKNIIGLSSIYYKTLAFYDIIITSKYIDNFMIINYVNYIIHKKPTEKVIDTFRINNYTSNNNNIQKNTYIDIYHRFNNPIKYIDFSIHMQKYLISIGLISLKDHNCLETVGLSRCNWQ